MDTLDLFRRAGALCAASEPHRAADEDWPCAACLKRVSAAASNPESVVPASGPGFDGVAGNALLPQPGAPGSSHLSSEGR